MVEGPKAGGHLGFKKEQLQDQHYALEALIPEVVMIASSYKEQKQIPVIAAGGISTGEDIAHFMELGAAGVQMGSIFVTTQECDASETFKEVYIHSKSEDVLIIAVSYTHLRAHETDSYLVCRLLLEKKKRSSFIS